MGKKLVCVGYTIPGSPVKDLSWNSDQSLLDADVILFQPNIPYEYYSGRTHQGKTVLTETGSFRVVQEASHWKAELTAALDEGKTVFVFLAKPEEVLVFTGSETTSGTGRNQKVVQHVRAFSSYSALPLDLTVVPRGGDSVRVADLAYLATYWQDFGKDSPFQVYLEGDFSKVCLTTRTGNKVVAAATRIGRGRCILLPPVQYDEEAFTILMDDEEGEQQEYWTDKADEFGANLVIDLLEIDKTLSSEKERTPAPSWTADRRYRMAGEARLETEVARVTQRIGKLQREKTQHLIELEEETGLRRLLYEQGKELEVAVLRALTLLGFHAYPFQDAESEFDAVFVSTEGRFLGEAEGKDRKAINITKLDQLERNIREDFEKEDVKEHAKGVLFGNAFRLLPPSERPEFFTDKCRSSARRTGVALVRTPDLFEPAKYLRENDDPAFATKCREAIFAARGDVVVFPSVPKSAESSVVIQEEGDI